jgi:hypothetical protein
MSNLPARNRVIYQSEALFISPDCTGYHLYYKPKNVPQSAVYPDDCLIQGTAKDGATSLFFDACKGVTRDSAAPGAAVAKDYNFTALPCTGMEELDPDDSYNLSGFNPILHLVGFDGNLSISEGTNANSLEKISTDNSIYSSIEQLKRVQSANYSFTINRQDINQFGHLGRLDSVVLESPTVSLDYSYYLTDGENERLLGMITDGSLQSLSGMMTRTQNEFGNNYFILTVPEGRDAVLGDQIVADANKTVIGLGNSYITDYSIEASVGSFPTVSVTAEGMNIKSDVGTDWKINPAIDPTDGTLTCNSCFKLPPSATGDGQSVLKPGDITIDLKNASLISKQISGDSIGYGSEDKGSAHIQSFTLSTPMGRTDLQRLGSSYSYAKEIDFPITCTLTVNALVADLKDGNLLEILCAEKFDLSIKMQNPQCPIKCEPNSQEEAIVINFNQAVLDSESFSSAIGDNKTVDLTFTTQIGGPEEKLQGVFISGVENLKSSSDGLHRRPPQVAYDDVPGGTNILKFYPYGKEGTRDYDKWRDGPSANS